ncbi:hypothetical protein LTR84_006460 [Exophiala bonariae]|uniref:Uncharacterized protein n=1 Tax=Exophiala bonariae TaxID=1690606 RepID=A0AAV9N4S5_9EURO|nr:hypothetical protein LTR84_006460 [Exophiala bonariae]
MRLQLQILRHALPPVNIIHTTGTGPTSHTRSRDCTIAALLQDVNDLVPLESFDGEWGLEDYVVEVAATADQQTAYECLHFQTCEAVLRDDDEVIIRALSTEDLRVRRLGGRHQITSDGRHLVDGITFGKQWLRRTGRPGVTIPPRKRRRLEIEDPAIDEDSNLALLSIGPYPDHQTELHAIEGVDDEDEDDEDDEDFVDGESHSDNSEEDDEGVSITEENNLQIAIRQDFDDADIPAEPDFGEILDSPEHFRFFLQEILKDNKRRSKTSTQGQSNRKRAADDSYESPDLLPDDVRQLFEKIVKNNEQRAIEDGLRLMHALRMVDNVGSPPYDLHPRLKKAVGAAAEIWRKRAEDISIEVLGDASSKICLLEQEVLNSDGKSSKVAPAHLKRKRAEDDDGDEVRDETFEGFSTPVKGARNLFTSDTDKTDDTNDSDFVIDTPILSDATSNSTSSESSSDSESEGDNILRIVEEKENDSTSPDDSSDSGISSDSESESEDEADDTKEDLQAIEHAKERALRLMRSHGGDSSTSSELSSEEEEMVREKDEDDSSSSRSDSSSASSDSVLDASSDRDLEGGDHKNAEPAPALVPRSIAPTLPELSANRIPAPKSTGSAPGEGSARTHRNNDRGKRRRRLMALKKQGILPENADLKSLTEYEEGGIVVPALVNLIEPTIPKNEPDNLQAAGQSQSMVVEQVAPVNQPSSVSETIATQVASTDAARQVSSETVDTRPSSDPSPRRTKLDLASSRRMVFSALGVRTPKDKAAEAALREKLSKTNRPLKYAHNPNSLQLGDQTNVQEGDKATTGNLSSWEDKLIVSAVECERDGWKLPPPPFPFQQGWAKGDFGGKGKNKRQARDDRQYYHGSNNETGIVEVVSTLNYDDEPQMADTVQASAALSCGDVSVPTEFDSLQNLERDHLVQGAVIAYKELQMDHTTNYQPTVSTYKVGRVEQVEPGDTVRLLLAKQFWEGLSTLYDENTGERILGKFAISADDIDDTPDDGIREVQFGDMISPKLVQASTMEVPKSRLAPELRGGHLEDALGATTCSQTDVIPESAEPLAILPNKANSELLLEQVEITTPRRNEITTIIKEAGFDSVLDEQLLRPIQNPSDADGKTEAVSEPLSQSQGDVAHRFRHGSPRVYQSSFQDISSEIDPAVEASAFSQDTGNIFPSEPDQESSPYMPTQGTVEYPHISQIEINSSDRVKGTNSSSHQDAQRISPAPLVDISFTISDHDKARSAAGDSEQDEGVDEVRADLSQDHEETHSITSEVPRSPSQDVEGETDRSPVPPAQPESFLGGRGYDGEDSSYQDDGFANEDSDGLPSIRELTSSQQNRKSTRSSVVVEVPIKKSPQPIRATTRRLKSERRSMPSKSPEIMGLPSLPAIKSSESQGVLMMSQIPTTSQFIDLTQSSPSKDDDDDHDFEAPSKSQANGKNKASSKVTKRALGIGNRRLLTKKRSYF